jgi:hypothetical protein
MRAAAATQGDAHLRNSRFGSPDCRIIEANVSGLISSPML